MKKMVVALFALMLLLTACDPLRSTENDPISQQNMISLLQPKLEKAPTYEKFTRVFAKEAVGGEKIATITKDGVETENTAAAKDMIVKNQTEAKEMYILKPDKFAKRYKQIREAKDGFKEYQAIGEIKAIEVTSDLLKEANIPTKEFYFLAAWEEKMIVKEGDYLVSPLDYSEVYRIAKKEFFETYRLKEKQ
ncbi:hypothetical protein E1B06_12855 [Brevibacillus laterosporus]|uniref:hypothetical protein n=1 Tax=Brevibacillus laterosporus TaxID=1465 RepID=UPI0024075BBF|nr:hypothetical protein [Brevibacillus laterosporus]MDF9412583.1 hypothetical protein [Brevibacillus laterosporus]